MSKHAIVHIEFPVTDQEAAGKFYSELFGWQFHAAPELDYAMFAPQEGPGGGFPRADGRLYEINRPLVYVSTDDIEASLAKAETLGGATVMPKTEIPGQGWFAIFSDPDGNNVALYTDISQSGT